MKTSVKTDVNSVDSVDRRRLLLVDVYHPHPDGVLLVDVDHPDVFLVDVDQ